MDREPAPGTPAAQRTDRGSLTLALCMLACRLQARLTTPAARSDWRARWLDSGQFLLGAFFNAALTVAEKSRLTIAVYDVHPTYHNVPDRLEPWEQRWFEKRLPAAPAPIMVGGCGTGREVTALARQGYTVLGFEPAPAFVAASRARVERLGAEHPHLPRVEIVQLSYEQLSRLVLDASTGDGAQATPANPVGNQRFAAILLGCGSLSHILDPRERARLMRALNVLCPAGPVLVSFSSADEEAGVPYVGRAARIGAWAGRLIGRLRGLQRDDADRARYGARYGFAYPFTRADIEQLAAGAARRTLWEQDAVQSNYATLLAPPPDQP